MGTLLRFLVAAATACLPASWAGAQITMCPPGMILANGACHCPSGKVSNVDTAGHCCWHGQAWSAERGECVGIPSCPQGTTQQAQDCVPSPATCPPGYERQGAWCAPVPVPPPPGLYPMNPTPPLPPAAPDADDRHDGLEFVATGGFVVNDEARGLGASVALGGQWYRRFSGSSGCGSMDELAAVILLFGLPCVPPSVWVGNDHGFKLHYHFTSVDSNLTEERLEQHRIGLSVPLLMHFDLDEVRLTLPSFVGLLLPEGGVVLRPDEDASFYLELAQLPLGLWLTDHIGLVVEPSLLVLPHLQDPQPPVDESGRPFFFSLDAGATVRF